MAITLDGTNGITSSGVITAPDGSASAPAITNDGDTNTGEFFPAADTIAWTTGGTERMRVDSSGNVGIGTSSPTNILTVSKSDDGATEGPLLELYRYSASPADNDVLGGLIYTGKTSLNNTKTFSGINGFISNVANANASGGIIFNTRNSDTYAERARITSGGYLKTTSDGSYNSSTGTYNEIYQTANSAGLYIRATNGSYTNTICQLQGDRTTTNATFNFIYAQNGNGTGVFAVRDSGNCVNTNNSYGSTSDVKLKQDIVDAGSQWNDIKNIRIRKYRFKNNSDGFLQIGVVAQEIEEISPGLIEENKDTDNEGNDLGTTTKSVKYSILYMKAVKALQEAMERIEALEVKLEAQTAEIAALKAKE